MNKQMKTMTLTLNNKRVVLVIESYQDVIMFTIEQLVEIYNNEQIFDQENV